MKPPENTANDILDKLCINSIDDLMLLDKIVYARGALIRDCPMQGAEARLLVGHDKPIISVSSSLDLNNCRRRFSIAHELGHLEMHRNTDLLKSCTTLDIQDKPDNAKKVTEQEANYFASSFLMPARFIEAPFINNEPSFDLIAEWAKKLETSLTATALRFTHFTNEPVAVVYSHQGRIKYYQSSSEFNELGVFPDVSGPVGLCSEAQNFFSGKKLLNKWHVVRAANWFRKDGNAFDHDDMIREWSIGMPKYEAVLSLLWVHEPLGKNSGW